MTTDEKLTALLRLICPRTFCDFAPTDTERPYCTYQVIGGDTLSYLDAVVPNKENAEVQISIWSDSRLEATAMIKRVEVAMIMSPDFQASPLSSAAADYDADMNVRSARQDFTVWDDR